MSNQKVLIIEDDQDLAEELMSSIPQNFTEMICTWCNFPDAKDRVREYRPHALVIDLFKGDSTIGDSPGTCISKFIQEQLFRPIIVHSADPNNHDTEHPLVTNIQKGRDSVDMVMDTLKHFQPFMEAIRKAENHIDESFTETMKVVAPHAFGSFGKDDPMLAEVVSRASRRRIAARMDCGLSDEKLAPWEIYLCPPISDHFLLGDILKKKNPKSSRNSPSSEDDPFLIEFVVVLTPSCDLVRRVDKPPRAREVLVALCYSVNRLAEKDAFSSLKNTKSKVKTELLTRPHFNGLIALPEFGVNIPTMVVDLRSLELIPIKNIETGGEYERVASIDSPFREVIAWAYADIAGKPGVPDRDFDLWQDQIIKLMKEGSQ